MAKLDMTQAWDSAVRKLNANRELVFILGGVFFFLPQLAFSLLTPAALSPELAASGSVSPEQLIEALNSYFAEYWWAVVISSLVQIVGTIAVLNVLGAADRPTVSTAVERGARSLPIMLLTQIMVTIAALLPLAIAYGLIASGSLAVLGGILVLPAAVVGVYLYIKFSLTSPIIALQDVRNPVDALKQSWHATKQNSFRLFAFYALLIIGFGVIFAVTSLVIGVIFALGGETLELIGTAIFGSLMSAVFAIFSYGVLAAVYRQLSASHDGPSVPKAG
ncbi:hypothetical protein ACRAQ7_07495 [Erythrobacter sp. W53]|uniref:hypothetical protein n=1 Tax=Erythrobacter sp. W53 TaxID=3425947 RepID=UPI003D76990B